jgi:hypothetical protein
MRRVLLKVLLIAVFLNAAIGVPLHAAVHLAGSAPGEAVAFAAGEPAPPEQGEDHDDRSQATCAWCLAHAEMSGAPPAASDAPLAGHSHGLDARPTRDVAPAFSAGLWSSSPRGPPTS